MSFTSRILVRFILDTAVFNGIIRYNIGLEKSTFCPTRGWKRHTKNKAAKETLPFLTFNYSQKYNFESAVKSERQHKNNLFKVIQLIKLQLFLWCASLWER